MVSIGIRTCIQCSSGPDGVRSVDRGVRPKDMNQQKRIKTRHVTHLHRLMWSYGMILAGLGMGLLYWLLEAIVHAVLLREGGFRTGMAPHGLDELWTRLFVVACFLVLGAAAQWLLVKRRYDQQRLLQRSHELGERVKELNCLYSISRLTEHSIGSLAEALRRAVDFIPPSMQYPEIACARITVGDDRYSTGNFRVTEWRRAASINAQGRDVGTVEVYYLEERAAGEGGPFVKEEGALIDGIGELLGRMVAQSRAQEGLRRARSRIERLHEVARQLERVGSEDDVYRITVEAAETILSFAMCTMDIVVGNRLVTKATSSELPSGTSYEGDLDSGGLAVETYRTGKTTVFGSLAKVPRANPIRADLRSGISAPIGADIGVFQVASMEANAFTDEDVRLLELLLGYAAEAIQRLRLAEQLRKQALRDPLTGVYNRRYFNQAIGQEAERSRRYGHSIGFLMIDVDRFKEINDRHGHRVGDQVLQEVAELLENQVREMDIVVRYGGDEFLVVLPETYGEAEAVRQRILEEAARRNEASRAFGFPVTLSVGSAHWSPASGRPMEEVLAEADARMYEAKRRRQETAEERT